MIRERNNSLENYFRIKIFLLVCTIGVTIFLIIEYVNIFERNQYNNKNCLKSPRFWLDDSKGKEDAFRLLKHVQNVLEKVGYQKKSNKSKCDLLWFHNTPFSASQNTTVNLQPHQILNHFPGMHFITDEVLFATTKSTYIPQAFILPMDKHSFVNYVSNNAESLVLMKKTNQSSVLKKISDIDLHNANGDSFVQEYIQKPFLVDDFKVDIGVFVVVTSVDPLRAYWYKGDVLIRFSKDKFSKNNTSRNQNTSNKDYFYTWDMPSLQKYFKYLNNGMKNAFDIFLQTRGKESSSLWENVQQAISEILLIKEGHIVEAVKRYGSEGKFFEILRFDLTVTENLKVYLLGANTLDSISLNSHSSDNHHIALFYEQLLYNVFALTGISREIIFERNSRRGAPNMVSSTKHIAVFGNECQGYCIDNCEVLLVCQLCRLCTHSKLRNTLLKAHAEYIHRGEFRRLVPPMLEQLIDEKDSNKFKLDLIPPKHLSLANKLHYLWYQGKCNQDILWCA